MERIPEVPMKIAVVLGNRLNDDGTISAVLKSRLDLAWNVWTDFCPDKMILSGGIANPKTGHSEASQMYRYLVDKGVPKDILLLEDRSVSTWQNAKFSVQIAKGFHADILMVVTSSDHLTRWYLNPIKLFTKEIGDADIRLMTYTACK